MTILLTKVYDAETGDGALELTGSAQSGRYDLCIYHNSNDLSLYSLTDKELLDISQHLQDTAYKNLYEKGKPKRIELYLSLPEYYALRKAMEHLPASSESETTIRNRISSKLQAIGDRLPRRRTAPRGECRYCDEHHAESMMPYHDASHRCESGKKPHCTCDTCF